MPIPSHSTNAPWRILSVLGLVACGGAPPTDDLMVATYQHGEITHGDYATWLAGAKGTDTPDTRLDNVRRLALAQMLASEIESPSPRLTFALDHAADQILERALRQEITATIVVSDAEVEAELGARDAERHQPRKMQLRNLFKRAPPDATPIERDRLRAEMDELRQSLLTGTDFGDLARRASDSQTRVRGGRMGMVEPGQLSPTLEAVATALAPGEISEVLVSADGFTLLKCERVVEAKIMTEDVARDRLRRYLERQQRRDAWQARRDALLALAKPRYDLETARDLSAAEDIQVVHLGSRALDRRHARWLLAQQPTRPALESVAPATLREILEAYVITIIAADHAREQALHQRPDIAARLIWQDNHLRAGEALQRRIRAVFTPATEETLRARFEAAPTAFVRPPEYRLAIIRHPSTSDQRAAAAAELARLATDLQAGSVAFEAAARQRSRHPSARNGGHLPWLPKPRVAQLGPDVLGAVETLAVDQTSAPIWQDGAFWIVRMLGEQPARPMTFDEARLRIENALGNEQTKRLRSEVERDLLDALDVRLVER